MGAAETCGCRALQDCIGPFADSSNKLQGSSAQLGPLAESLVGRLAVRLTGPIGDLLGCHRGGRLVELGELGRLAKLDVVAEHRHGPRQRKRVEGQRPEPPLLANTSTGPASSASMATEVV